MTMYLSTAKSAQVIVKIALFEKKHRKCEDNINQFLVISGVQEVRNLPSPPSPLDDMRLSNITSLLHKIYLIIQQVVSLLFVVGDKILFTQPVSYVTRY